MGYLSDLQSGMKKAIPWLSAKIGTFLLFIFALGMFFGWFIAQKNDPIWLLGPVVAMVVTWHKFDEGYLLFAVLVLLAVFL